MAVITISRGSLSGGEHLAEYLGRTLGYDVISREVIVGAARKFGVSEADLSNSMKNPPGLWRRRGRQQDQFILAVSATLADMVKEGRVVYHGHAGQFLLKDLPRIIKLRLIAPLEYRLRSAMQKHGFSRKEALDYIAKVDAERTAWVRELYNAEWSDPSLYDLVINLEQMSIETAGELVVDLVRRKEYQQTPESDQELHDFALTMRVRAALAFHSDFPAGSVDVKSRLGVIRLSGGRYFAKNKQAVVRFVESVEGAHDVITDEEAPMVQAFPRELKASDVLLPLSRYPHVHPWASIRETMGALGTSTIRLNDGYLISPRFVLVVDEEERLVGIVNRRDLLLGLTPQLETLERARGHVASMVPLYDLHQAMAFQWKSLFDGAAIANSREPVRTIMEPIRGTVRPDDDLSVVVTTMIHYRFDLVPVMDGDKVAGVVLMTDIFDTVAQFIMEQRAPHRSRDSQ